MLLEMKRSAVIQLNFQSEKHLKAVLKALKPETRRLHSSRSRMKVVKEDGKLTVHFAAKDTTALRAAINAYLRWIGLAQNALETVDGLSRKENELSSPESRQCQHS